MKKKFLFISILLMVVLSIGAVSATAIDNELDSNSDISISSDIDLDVESDGFDYVCDDIGTNDSDSSLLGVSEDEEGLIGDGQFTRVEFKDEVDGVITFMKAENWEPGSEGDWDSYGYQYSKIYFNVYDENDNVIKLDSYNSDFDFNGKDAMNEYFSFMPPWDNGGDGVIDDYQYIKFDDCMMFTDQYSLNVFTGTYDFVLCNADRSFSQKVTLVLMEPRKLDATVTITDVITVDISTNDGPANFTVYVADEKVANGTVGEDGKSSVSFEKIFGSNTLKIVQDGVYATGLTYEQTIYVPEELPGGFWDLDSKIRNSAVIDLDYNFTLYPAEYGLYKDGINVNNDITINGNNHVINGTDLVRIFNIGNNSNVILKDLIISDAYATSGHGGAIYLGSGTLTVENCTFIDNVLYEGQKNGGAIYAEDRTTLTIKDSLFKNNTNKATPKDDWYYGADQYGGAVACGDYVNFNVVNTQFIENKGDNNNERGRGARAGAIYSIGSNSNNNIINCTFINNTASNGNGAIYTRNANITGCIFVNNSADNDWPTIYYEGNGKGTISYNIFKDNSSAQIRLRNNAANVAEEYNWWITNNPENLVRIENTLSTPKKYLRLEAYNEGETIYAGFIRDSDNNAIPDIDALPVRQIIFEGNVDNTELELTHGIATVTYTSPITGESSINATVDGYTINYTLSAGTIDSIDVLFVENTTVRNNGTIVISVSGNNGPVDGTLAVYLNGTMYEVPVVKGVVIVNKGDELIGGIYDIYYEYLGSPNYAPTLKKEKSDSKFEIEKRDVEITYSINPDNGYITYAVKDSEMSVSGSVTCNLDNGWSRTWGSTSGTTNLDSSLSNGTHGINLTYSGDNYHNAKQLVDTFDVVKYIPPCIITQDGGKFTFNFTSELSYGGRVSVDFVGPNSFSQNYGNLQRDGVASVDVTKKLMNGSYTLTVHFTSSKYKYVSYDFNYSFDILKHNVTSMTISPEQPTKTVNTVLPVTITITVEDGYPIPTGKVSIPTGSEPCTGKLNENGVVTIDWVNRADKMGPEVKTITYEGDINYDPFSIEVTFVCDPTGLDVKLTSNGNNVTLTFNDKYGHDNNGVVHVYDYDEYLGNVTGNDGFPEFKINDLDSGAHYFTVVWQNNNGNNYTSSKSIVINRTPGTSQWVTTGFDNKNSGNPDYTRPVDDVYVLWSNDQSINITKYPNNIRKEYTGEITRIVEATYSPLIGSDGLIFLNDGYLVYVYDMEGNVLFSKAPGRKVPGIGLYNDSIVMAERTDDEIVIYDFITGESYSGTFQWVSCSMYYPVEGPDGRVYIVSEYNNMANNGNWITVIDYTEGYNSYYSNTNKFNWNAAYIDTEAIAPPVFDDEGNMWVATKGGIRAVNIYSGAKIFSDSKISTNARPAISDSNIVFYLSKETENSLYALTAEGYLWNTTVSGTVGTTLAIDNENGFVYSVNKEGKLYKYDINNGTETFVYDLGAKAKSIIVDGDSKVYVGDTNGYVTALDSEGNLLWAINLGAPIAGGLAMNNEGIIYAYTNDTLFALGYRDPISIEVTVPEGNYKAFDNVTVTATLNETVEGNVTFTINGKNTTVAINGTVAELTTTIPGGNQTIVATFEGNDAYMPATGNATVDIAKLDVEFENVPEGDVIEQGSRYIFYYNIISNGVNVTTGTTKGIDENGKQYTANWKYYANMGWQARITNIAAGNHTVTIVYSGDDTYNAANKTFSLVVLPKVTPTATIDDDANEITVDVTISADDATGKFTVIANNETIAEGTIENGTGSVTFAKLAPGTYDIIVAYEGDDNYLANNGTVSIKIPRTSQWPSVGGNPQNSGIANATREDGVSIIWEAALNGDLRSSAIIDGLGNIYVNDGSKIYSFTSNGTLRWSGGIGSAGIALYKDELVLAPQYHNAMMIYNATTGAAINGNFWSASSNFAPITGPDGRIYTPTDYGYPADGQGWSGNYWISVLDETGSDWEPYGFNLFLVEITGVGYGSQALKASPSFDSLGYIYANTVKGFKIVNIATGATVFSDTNINGVGRPVIDSNNIAYILDATLNGIYAISTEGILWNATVSDAIGTTLAVDNENGFLYAVNANGTLYKYDTTDGSESLVYELNSTGVSIILDADSNVYVSTAAGDVVAVSADGELLWTINLGSKVTGQLAMDNNGIIYAVADKTLYALGFDSNLTVDGENVTVFDNEIITVTISAEGNVTISFNGEETEVPVENGTATLDLGKLPAGTYTVSVTYDGDGITYGPAFAETTFEIIKADVEITEDIVASVENSTLTLTLPEDATGIVLAKVDGKGYYAEVENGTAVIEIPALAAGNYTVDITYLGDDNYNNASLTTELEVPELLDAELEADVDETVITVNINENATGKVIVTVGNDSYIKDASEAPITIDVADLPAGTYDVTVEYLGDENFLDAAVNTTVTVPEVVPEDANVTVDVNDTEVSVELPEDATGYVVVSVNGTDYFFDAGDDIALDLSDLAPGEYPVEIAYSGDDKYAPATANTTVTVPEVVPEDANVTVAVNDSDVSVELPEDAEGYVVVSVGDKKYYFDADDEIALDLSDLAPGEYPVEIAYSGDDKYAPATANTTVTVPEVVPEDANLTADAQNTTITVTVAENATGNILVDVNGTGYFAPIENGQATVEVIGLDEGTYDAVVTYDGDDTYAPANTTVAVTVPAAPKNETDVDPEANVTASEDAIEIELPEDATGYMLVDVDGTGYYVPVENGTASFELPELAPGNHTVSVTYTGDKKYAPANTTETIEVPAPEETIISEDLTKVEKAPQRFVATFLDENGNPLVNASVTFDVNGAAYTRTTNANGSASIAINLIAGNYTITLTNPATGEVKTNNITVL
ncbi:Ig-like domain repeat protein, partial [Methanobrevibacter sp.]|uniref:Ig-like domain repeat protein n=1 Tax=Methanobrevibacter sp. TaxID=66852 RepID=UPI0038904B15